MGEADPEAMLAVMPGPVFEAWKAYANVEPFGEERADLRMGILAALIANVNRDAKKRKRPFEPKDFMPQFGQPPKEPQTWQEQLTIVEMLNAAFGGKDLRGKKAEIRD